MFQRGGCLDDDTAEHADVDWQDYAATHVEEGYRNDNTAEQGCSVCERVQMYKPKNYPGLQNMLNCPRLYEFKHNPLYERVKRIQLVIG